MKNQVIVSVDWNSFQGRQFLDPTAGWLESRWYDDTWWHDPNRSLTSKPDDSPEGREGGLPHQRIKCEPLASRWRKEPWSWRWTSCSWASTTWTQCWLRSKSHFQVYIFYSYNILGYLFSFVEKLSFLSFWVSKNITFLFLLLIEIWFSWLYSFHSIYYLSLKLSGLDFVTFE